MERMLLVGTEEVSNAARTMQRASEDMLRAANQFDTSLVRHQDFLNIWLSQLEEVLAERKNV